MRSAREKPTAFPELRENGCFILPNPWDIGSAKLLQHLGFAALASPRAGLAWAAAKLRTGKPQ